MFHERNDSGDMVINCHHQLGIPMALKAHRFIMAAHSPVIRDSIVLSTDVSHSIPAGDR